MGFKQQTNITGWVVFTISALVYIFSAESTGSLWDCGEFISSAYKLQVCHPPGAPLFLMVGRLFTWVAGMFSKDPATIAYAVNVFSGICTALSAMFICWVTMSLGKLTLTGRDEEVTDKGQQIALMAAGIVSGLCTTFASSVWFSAVEGEVYAMSLFFTAMIIWATMKWYMLPESNAAERRMNDRWLIFISFMMGLSSTVHLLSLLVFPMISMLYYLKRYENFTKLGFFYAFMAGVGLLGLFQFFLLPVVPSIGANFDYIFNGMGMPIGIGFLIFILALCAGIYFGIRYAQRTYNVNLEKGLLGFAVVMVGFSTYAMIYIRANANVPINMNDPSDPYTLVSYLKREQYGERPLVYGPHFMAKRLEGPDGVKETGTIYKPVGGKYQAVGKKAEPVYEPEDYMFLPRMGHTEGSQQAGYRQWLGLAKGEKPNWGNNIAFMLKHQIGWMYWRYFMWNFVGRQNFEQGTYSGDPTNGNWISGIGFVDNMHLGFDTSKSSKLMLEDKSRNTYYMLPLLFGLLGLFFHFMKRPNEATITMVLFVMTGIAIVMYLNEPPYEPRERDYGHAGSFMAFTIWIGMGVIALYDIISKRAKLASLPSAAIAALLVFTAPYLMGTQNWDDHSRAGHYGARDYASNFLNSLAPNAIVFTYGDNDTYPLWYAQEVEGIRRDVRVVNFSLLAVDWYINGLRRKINDSAPIKMTISEKAYTGDERQMVYNLGKDEKEMSLQDVIKFIGEDHPFNIPNGGGVLKSYVPTSKIYCAIDKDKVKANHVVSDNIPDTLIAPMRFSITGGGLEKDEIALLDIIANNINERPVYFAVTCRPEKVMGLKHYLQLEGLGLRVVPVKAEEDKSFAGGGILGYGRVDVDKTYDIIVNKWRWGNFDKMKTYIDRSYMPSVQSMQVIFMRLIKTLIEQGDKERALKVCAKYFEAFPAMNFPYIRSQAMSIIQFMADAGGCEAAIPHAQEILNEISDEFKFQATVIPQFNQQFQAIYNYHVVELQYRDAFKSKNDTILMTMDKKIKEARAALGAIQEPQGAAAYFVDDMRRYANYLATLTNVAKTCNMTEINQKIEALTNLYGK